MPAPEPADTVEDVLMALLITASQRMRQRLPGDAHDFSVLPVLGVLSSSGPIRLTELADRLGLDASTVSRRVRFLEDQRLVAVTADTEDRRARQVELLDAGRAAREQLLDQRRQLVRAALTGWSHTDREALKRLVHRLDTDLHALTTDTPQETDA